MVRTAFSRLAFVAIYNHQLLNCDPEIDKDDDNVPDNLDIEGPIDWSYCDLEGVNLSHRDLSGANMEGAKLWMTHLNGTDLSDANLHATNMGYAYLYGTDFSGADLSYAQLYKAIIDSNSTFDYANLSYANLCANDLGFYVFTGTDLSHADIDHAQLWGASLRQKDPYH